MAIQNWNGATLFAFTAELNDDARIIYTRMSVIECSEREDKPPTEESLCGQALDRAFELMTEAKQDAEEIWACEKRNREEHLEWCKERALRQLDAGHRSNAIAYMLADLDMREDTRVKPGSPIAMLAALYLTTGGFDDVRRFITGFR